MNNLKDALERLESIVHELDDSTNDKEDFCISIIHNCHKYLEEAINLRNEMTRLIDFLEECRYMRINLEEEVPKIPNFLVAECKKCGTFTCWKHIGDSLLKCMRCENNPDNEKRLKDILFDTHFSTVARIADQEETNDE